eukprot:8274935-Alexandrium_andersonii.AAC.1
MCPCNLQRRGECERCGRPCEHGPWVRVRGCDLCGVRTCPDDGGAEPEGGHEMPWVEDLDSIEDLSGLDDAGVSSLDIGAAQ